MDVFEGELEENKIVLAASKNEIVVLIWTLVKDILVGAVKILIQLSHVPGIVILRYKV